MSEKDNRADRFYKKGYQEGKQCVLSRIVFQFVSRFKPFKDSYE